MLAKIYMLRGSGGARGKGSGHQLAVRPGHVAGGEGVLTQCVK
jgi:hypothetical protein